MSAKIIELREHHGRDTIDFKFLNLPLEEEILRNNGAKYIIRVGFAVPPLGVTKYNEVLVFTYRTKSVKKVNYKEAMYAYVSELQSRELYKLLESLTFRPKNARELP